MNWRQCSTSCCTSESRGWDWTHTRSSQDRTTWSQQENSPTVATKTHQCAVHPYSEVAIISWRLKIDTTAITWPFWAGRRKAKYDAAYPHGIADNVDYEVRELVHGQRLGEQRVEVVVKAEIIWTGADNVECTRDDWLRMSVPGQYCQLRLVLSEVFQLLGQRDDKLNCAISPDFRANLIILMVRY